MLSPEVIAVSKVNTVAVFDRILTNCSSPVPSIINTYNPLYASATQALELSVRVVVLAAEAVPFCAKAANLAVLTHLPSVAHVPVN